MEHTAMARLTQQEPNYSIMHQKRAQKHDNNQNQKLYLKSNQGQPKVLKVTKSHYAKLGLRAHPEQRTHYVRAHYSIANARFSS